MRKLALLFLFLTMVYASYSQQVIDAKDIIIRRYFIWQGDTIDFDTIRVHGNSWGLDEDDHLQYALLSGRLDDILHIDSIQEFTIDHGVKIEGVKLYDSIINSLKAVQWTTGYTDLPHQESKMWWDDDAKTLTLDKEGGTGVRLQVGQEMHIRIYNNSGAQINNGKACKITGAQGNRPTIGLAQADTITNARIIGIATHDILNSSNGYITSFGLVRDINTTGTPESETWAAGDVLYLNASIAGSLTKNRPNADSISIFVGVVLNAHATEGIIFVNIDFRSRLSFLSDVNARGDQTDKQLLHWVTATNYWDTVSVSDVLGDGNLTANYVTKFDGVDLANSVIYDNGTNVGINTTVPSELLELKDTPPFYLNLNDGTYNNYIGVSSAGQIIMKPGDNLVRVNNQLYAYSPVQGYTIIGNSGNDKYGLKINDDNSTTVMFVDTLGGGYFKGNLGIGTTSPSQKFHIHGVAGLPATIGTTQTGITRISQNLSTGVMDVGYSNTYGGWLQVTASDDLSTYDDLLLNARGGNIGIGVINPSWKMEVVEGANAISGTNITVANLGLLFSRRLNNNAGIGLGFSASSTVGSGTGGAILFERTGGYGQGKLHFATKSTTTDDATIPIKMTIDKDGNVGIGTVNPSNVLDINSSVGGFDTKMQFSTGTSTVGRGAAIFFKTSSSTIMDRYGVKIGSVRALEANGAADFVISLENAGAIALDEVLRIRAGGNVGIGTTSPAYGLDVNNHVRIVDSVRFDDAYIYMQNLVQGSEVGGDSLVTVTNSVTGRSMYLNISDVASGGGAAGGESNTASSVGSGTSIYFGKSGVDLQFNAIKSENTSLTVGLDGTSHDVEFTLVEDSIDHNQLTNYVATKHYFQKDIDTVNNALSGLAKLTNGVISAITDNSGNWNTAYGWGDHGAVGYLEWSDTSTLATKYYVGSQGFITATLTKEETQDYAWDVLGGTQTLITVTYQDATNDVDFVVDNDLSHYSNATSGFITGIVWGDITGTLSNQSDLQTALDGKYDEISATNNYLTKFGTSGTTVLESIIYDDGTNVGIGTTTPQTKLHVEDLINPPSSCLVGNETGTDGTIANIYMENDDDSSLAGLFFTKKNNDIILDHSIRVGASTWINYLSVNGTDQLLEIGEGIINTEMDHTGFLIIPNTTGVGIGTTSPSEKLEVNGNVKASIFKGNLEHTLTRGYGLTGSNFNNSAAATWKVDTSEIATQYYVGSQGFITATLTKEETQDYAWDVLGGTQTLITVTYQDATNDVDFIVNEASIDHNNLTNYVSQKHYYQKDIDTVNNALSGLAKVASGVISAITDNSGNWNTAYGWGDHGGDIHDTADILRAEWRADINDSLVANSQGFITSTLSKETVQDYAWDVLGGTQTLITVTYQDATNDVDFVVNEASIDHNNLTNYVSQKHYYQKDIDTVNNALSGLAKVASGVISAITDNSGNWNTAYGWGDHGAVGYLEWSDTSTLATKYYVGSQGFITATLTKEETQDYAWDVLGGTQTLITVTYQDATNDVDFVVNEASIDHNNLTNYVSQKHYYQKDIDTVNNALSGLAKVASGVISAITDNSGNWNTAYGWGDHGAVGYLEWSDTSTLATKYYVGSQGFITGNETVTLSNDVTGSGTTSIVCTVVDDSHNHIISNVDGLQTALDGKYDEISATTNYLTKFGTSGTTVLESIIYDNGTNVGIGSATPAQKLDVNGIIQSNGLEITSIANTNELTALIRDGTSIKANNLSNDFAAISDSSLWTLSGANIYSKNADNVGIGSTVPAQKLDVNGTIQQTGFKLTTLPTNGYVLKCDAAGVGTWQASAGGGNVSNTGTPVNNQVAIFTDATTIEGDVDLIFDGTNLGIGVATPQNKLDIEGAAVIGAAYSGTNTAPTNGLLVEGNVGIGTTTAQKQLHVNGNTAFIGNVGIGVVTPAYKLQVSGGGIHASGDIEAELDLIGNNIIFDGTQQIYIKYGIAATTDSELRFYNAYDAAETVIITNSGNVGIGTTAPITTLDVQGGFATEVRTITASTYSIHTSGEDCVLLCDPTSAQITITLPTSSVKPGQHLWIKNSTSSGNSVVINNSSDALKWTLTDLQGIHIVSDGTNWHVIGLTTGY